MWKISRVAQLWLHWLNRVHFSQWNTLTRLLGSWALFSNWRMTWPPQLNTTKLIELRVSNTTFFLLPLFKCLVLSSRSTCVIWSFVVVEEVLCHNRTLTGRLQAIVWHSLLPLNESANAKSCHLLPADVYPNLWPRFKKKEKWRKQCYELASKEDNTTT